MKIIIRRIMGWLTIIGATQLFITYLLDASWYFMFALSGAIISGYILLIFIGWCFEPENGYPKGHIFDETFKRSKERNNNGKDNNMV